MPIGRTLPPAAAPLTFHNIINGFKGLFNGKQETDRFTSELKSYFEVKHCFLVSSGKAALMVILQALHELHPQRDEVLIPAFTCYSVPASINRAGLKIKLYDLDPDTLDFTSLDFQHYLAKNDPQDSQRLLAVLPTHLFGISVKVDALRDLIDNAQVTIIEDAAQAMGGEDTQGNKLGTVGDIGFFSLDRGKALSTVEGGIIITDNDEIAKLINKQVHQLSNYSFLEGLKLALKTFLITFFQHPALFWIPKSLPFLKLGQTLYDPDFKIRKFTSFQAGLSRNWRIKLENFQKIRRQNANKLSHLSPESLKKKCSLTDKKTDLIRFPLFLADKSLQKKVLAFSNSQGLGIMSTYPTAINDIEEINDRFKGQKYPGAKQISETLLTLPIHPLVTQNDIHKIDTINQWLQF